MTLLIMTIYNDNTLTLSKSDFTYNDFTCNDFTCNDFTYNDYL